MLMQAELSVAGEYIGLVRLNSEGVTTFDMFDPVQQEQVERAFRQTAPIEYAAGYEGDWDKFTHSGDRVWFEKFLRSLSSEGYEYKLTTVE
jgi:hypothetical protein